jgi:hypothetical protein
MDEADRFSTGSSPHLGGMPDSTNASDLDRPSRALTVGAYQSLEKLCSEPVPSLNNPVAITSWTSRFHNDEALTVGLTGAAQGGFKM